MIKTRYSQQPVMNVFTILVLIASIFGSCEKDEPKSQGAEYLELSVQGSKTHQTIHGFGASDAWSCQFIGKNWPQDKKEQIADWLFSTQFNDDSNPKGIGLNIWRFNIGGGSALQGGASGIGDEWRRSESFMTGANSYNWENHAGQRWFMKAAKERGVNTFIGFVNSPPVQLTKNGKAFSSSSNSYNLAEENYENYASYLADIVENIKQNDGIEFKYISPFNEPQWDWTDGGQEGTPARNTEIAAAVKVINQKFSDRNLNALLEIPESAQIQFMYSDHHKSGRGQQIQEFFTSSSENYVGNLSHVAKKIAGHSYYSTWPLSDFADVRNELAQEITSATNPIEFWMTEYCALEDNSEIKGNGRDLGMNTALYTARVIYTDIVLANAASWQWWLAISPYDYKDGLVYTDKNKFDGNIYDSKNLWAMGNFSRFVKQGMTRVDVTRGDFRPIEQTFEGVMSTCFTSSDKSKVTIVLINYSNKEVPIKISTKDLPDYEPLNLYITNSVSGNNLSFSAKYSIGEVYNLPARSVVTITNED